MQRPVRATPLEEAGLSVWDSSSERHAHQLVATASLNVPIEVMRCTRVAWWLCAPITTWTHDTTPTSPQRWTTQFAEDWQIPLFATRDHGP